MSNITTKEITKIQTTETQIRKNFYRNYLELLNDVGHEEDPSYFECEVNRLSGAIQDSYKNGLKDLFAEGYTMLLLDSEEFEVVENMEEGDEIQIVIAKNDGSTEVVTQDDLSY